MGKSKKWLPLESNPELFKDYTEKLGVIPTTIEFNEIFSLEEEFLEFIPKNILAILLLFPMTEESEKAKNEGIILKFNEETRIEKDGQEISNNLYYMYQKVGNACGTIGLLHALLNNINNLNIENDSFIEKFYNKTKDKSYVERATFLENPGENDPNIEETHKEIAAAGETETPSLDEKIMLHFVCFVVKDNALYELDGRKKFPINHGTSSPNNILNDTVSVVKKFISRTDNLRFNLIALTKN